MGYTYGPDGFLVLECHFVRGLPPEQRITAPTLDTGLHIVAVPSNPLSQAIEPLNIDGEWVRLKEIIQHVPYAITLERTRPPTIEQVRTLVANQRHRVIHFMGHGGQDERGALLYFEQNNGDLNPVTAKQFVLRVRGTVFLVTLNACVSAAPGPTPFSNLAFALARQKIPYALGMRFSISDEDARAFSRTFYNDLAHGVSIEEALFQARLTLSSSLHSWAVSVPVLYTALSKPAQAYSSIEGTPIIKEHQPEMKISALTHVQGTFQGRAEDLKQLGSDLTGDNRSRILTIHGGGGLGKTTLAREAAERFAYAWPGGIWATSLEPLPSRAFFVIDLAYFLGIDTQTILDNSVRYSRSTVVACYRNQFSITCLIDTGTKNRHSYCMRTTTPYTTIASSFDQFTCELDKSPLTIQAYSADIQQFITWLNETDLTVTGAHHVTRSHINDYLRYLANKGRTGTTRSRKMVSLQLFFTYLVQEGVIPDSPTAKVKRPHRERKPKHVLRPNEFQRMIGAARGSPRDYALLELLLQTGIRVSELIAICVPELDLEHKTLLIHGTGVRKMVEKYLKRAGITKKISCHGLHYTCATNRAALWMISFCLRTPLDHKRVRTSKKSMPIGTEELRKLMEFTSL